MYNHIPGKFIVFQMTPIFLGGWLTLIANPNPAQAQVSNEGVLLSQRTVFETLPPPPNLQEIPYNQQPLNQSQPIQPGQFEQYEQNLRPSQPVGANQYSQNFQRYLVYVESGNSQTLEQVRRIESGAYFRQYQGRSIIQSGIFNRQSNAEQRVRELESSGVNGARIISFANGQEITTTSYNTTTADRGNSPDRGNSRGQNSQYYVAIPASSKDLPAIASRIQQNIGRSGWVLQRQQPRGPHVAVGPFAQRADAEEWNKYVRNLGFGNARVYYGK
jgi:hypothetical protein